MNLESAWHEFLNYGNISKDIVRPEVAESWIRSKKNGRKPATNIIQFKKQPQPKSLLEIRRSEYAALISLARPIMKDISSLSGPNFVVLTNKDGYILEIVSNIHNIKEELHPTPGLDCSEDSLGTNAIGTALVEKRPIEIRGREHYAPFMDTYSCVAVPIHNPEGNIIGVLDISNPIGDLPRGTLETLKLAVKVLERQLVEAKQYNALGNNDAFSIIIDCLQDCLLMIDIQGLISNINKKALDVLEINDRKELVGKPLHTILPNPKYCSLPNWLFDNSKPPIKNFDLLVDGNLVQCSLLNKHIVSKFNRQETVVLFSSIGSRAKFDKKSGISNTSDGCLATFDHLIGKNQVWIDIVNKAKKAARVSSNVLIEGESGTGKELIAQAIHTASDRMGSFIAINCGGIPKELLQSELFGYEEGSFTGAKKGGRMGKFEMADGGTVFLDEIGEMPIDMQVSLLRFLQDKSFTRVGGAKNRHVDVRIIAATNRNLKEEIHKGNFREDLYYRLNVINLKLPPLRNRKSDIPLIAQSLADNLCQEFNKNKLTISDEACNLLVQYDWPGNVRELSNIMENAVVFAEKAYITEDLLPAFILENNSLHDTDVSGNLKDNERQIIINTLKKFNGNISHTAKALGIARNTLYRKIDQFGIKI